MNPVRDVEVIETELVLADLQMVEGRLDKLAKKAKGDKDAVAQLECAKRLVEHLQKGLPAVAFPERESAPGAVLFQELGLITSKPVIFCANVDEGSLAADNAHVAGTPRLGRAAEGRRHQDLRQGRGRARRARRRRARRVPDHRTASPRAASSR